MRFAARKLLGKRSLADLVPAPIRRARAIELSAELHSTTPKQMAAARRKRAEENRNRRESFFDAMQKTKNEIAKIEKELKPLQRRGRAMVQGRISEPKLAPIVKLVRALHERKVAATTRLKTIEKEYARWRIDRLAPKRGRARTTK